MRPRRLTPQQNINRAISAGTWNGFCDLSTHADRVGLWSREALGRSGVTTRPHPGAILVRNTSGSALSRFQAVVLDEPTIDANQTDGEFDREIIFDVVTASSDRTKFPAVMLDDVPYNECGYAVVSGVIQCTIDVADSDHTHVYVKTGETYPQSNFGGPWRIVWKPTATGNGKRAIVCLGDACYTRKVILDADLDYGNSGQASFYVDGVDVGSETVYFDWMPGATTTLDNGTECVVQWFDDEERWSIINAEC